MKGAISSIMALGIHDTPSPTVVFVSRDLISSFPLIYSFLQVTLSPRSIIIPLTQLEFKHSPWMAALSARQWMSTYFRTEVP